MKKNEKIWSILVHMSMKQWSYDARFRDVFNEDFWNYIVDGSAKAGLNMIVLDVGDAVQFASHPEISDADAWSRKRVREEIRRCADFGIKLIPKLNFATTHDFWLGEYSRMISTSTYYRVCDDLIKEVYDIFEGPEYIHLGMDEERARNASRANPELVIYRQGDLFWHDLSYLMDSVHATGATPWIWSCPMVDHPEEYAKNIGNDAVISPWYYNAFRKEHWTPIESRAEYVAYYNEDKYASMGLKYVEEDPYLVACRESMIPEMKKHGYKYIPCASVFNRCDYNHEDLVEYFHDNAPDEQLLGFMSAPWVATDNSERAKQFYDETFKFYKEAKEKFYK